MQGYIPHAWWRHQMEIFSALPGHLCGEFTGHRWFPRTKASDAELGCFLSSAPWINDWVNNREAGDLRRHRAHHDVIVMLINLCWRYAAEFYVAMDKHLYTHILHTADEIIWKYRHPVMYKLWMFLIILNESALIKTIHNNGSLVTPYGDIDLGQLRLR